MNLQWFVQVVKDYRVVPVRLAHGTAAAIVALEGAAALFLLTGIWSLAGALATEFLLTVFTIVIGVNIVRGRRSLACGCGSPKLSADHIGWHLVARNCGLLGLAIVATGATANAGVLWSAVAAGASGTVAVGGLFLGRRIGQPASGPSDYFGAAAVKLKGS